MRQQASSRTPSIFGGVLTRETWIVFDRSWAIPMFIPKKKRSQIMKPLHIEFLTTVSSELSKQNRLFIIGRKRKPNLSILLKSEILFFSLHNV